MKKLLLVLTVVAMASFLLVGCFGVPAADEVVDIAAIPGVTAPVTGATPVTAITATAQYTGVVTWLPAVTTTFAAETVYTATITLTPVTGYTLTGVTVDFFTVASATAANLVDSGVVTALFPATLAAPVTPTKPVITAIADQEVFWDVASWTYQVVATKGTGTITGYSLTEKPPAMSISTTGMITWSIIPDVLAVHDVTVRVDASDGEFATGTFAIEVKAPVVKPLVIDIDVPDAYVHPTKGPIVAAKKYNVIVTFSDNSITEGKDVWARWSDVTPSPDVNGSWVKLTKNTAYTKFTGKIDFGEKTITECKPICIEVKVGTICCDPIIYSEMITVDTALPCASFTVTFKDCPCEVPPGAEMSWTTTCEDICDVPKDCCGDYCSGVGDWKFVLDDDVCLGPCDTETGNGCAITGAFECGCLPYSYKDTTVSPSVVYTGIHKVKVCIKDNVSNEFKDTWTITFDTDNVTGIVAPLATSVSTPTYDAKKKEWTVKVVYPCYVKDCTTCFP